MQSGGGGGDAPQDTQAAPQAATQQHAELPQASTAPPATDGGRVSASPVARRIAAEAGIDLRSLRGSGPYGRIVKADVESALQTGAPISKAPIDIEPSSMRRIVAERMTYAKQTVPHFYLESECHTDALVTTLRAINQSRTEDDPKVTFNDLLISCMAYAFKRVPEANVAWVDGKIRKFQQVDVSIAVASDEGLMTPVVTGVCSKSLFELASATADVIPRARSRKLAPHEYQGGTVSISNLGMFGISNFSAVINPPQSMILAIGATKRVPVVKDDDSIAIAGVMGVTLSVDHRAVDGALGATWLQAFKAGVETPALLLT